MKWSEIMNLNKSTNLNTVTDSSTHNHANTCLNTLSNVTSDYLTTTGSGYYTPTYPYSILNTNTECSEEEYKHCSLKSRNIRLFNETFIEEGLRTMMNTLNDSITKNNIKDVDLNSKIDSIAVLNKSKVLLISSTSKFGKYSVECRLLDTEREVVSESCGLILANMEDKSQKDLYEGVNPNVIEFICWESLSTAIENYKEELRKKNELS